MKRVAASRQKWQLGPVQVELTVRENLHHVQVHLACKEDPLFRFHYYYPLS